MVEKLVGEEKKKSRPYFGDKIERDYKGIQKLFYGVLKSLRNEKRISVIAIRNKEGKILPGRAKVMY